MSLIQSPNPNRRRGRKIDAAQFAFILAEPPRHRELPEFDSSCPRCGAPNFVLACGHRCRHCGFAPSCDD